MFVKLIVLNILLILSVCVCGQESDASPVVSNESADIKQESAPIESLDRSVDNSARDQSTAPVRPDDYSVQSGQQSETGPSAATDEPSVEYILLPDKKSPFLALKDRLSAPKNSSPAEQQSANRKLFGDNKQINAKHVQTRVALHQTTDAIYNCTQESVLSLLSMSADFDNYFVCNQVLDLRSDLRLNATIRGAGEQPFTPLTAYDAAVQLVFFKGNQLYYSSARVDSGYCEGDKLTMLNVGLARKGACNSRSGVKQIVSEYALLTLTGRCRSTCFGDVNVALSPGVRN